MKLYDRPRIAKFTNEIKKDNFIAYAKELVKTSINQASVPFDSYYSSKHPIIAAFWHFVGFIGYSLTFLQGFIVAACCFILLIYKGLKHKVFDWLYLGVFVFVILTYATSIIGTNFEYTRTAITSLPFILLALYLFIIRIIDYIQKTKNENILGENYDLR